MSETHEKLNQLQTRLEHLERYEKAFKREIDDIRQEIFKLRFSPEYKSSHERRTPEPLSPLEKTEETKPPAPASFRGPEYQVPKTIGSSKFGPSRKSNLERFVGTYLISVIGVLVTIIGVAIGAKFAIDNDLISPLMRIVFGYAVGLGLSGVAVRLKAKYETFSSVLISGGIAILYFITFFAYDYYALIPQVFAFALMAVFTGIAVYVALIYDRRIIAHIGLVGAYAVPFLLSEGSGRADILFSYVAIVNVGILTISVAKYWKYIFYSAFVFTWLIFAGWYSGSYREEQFVLAMTFVTVFFLIFYVTFLVYKLIHKKPLRADNVALVVLNSFAYFGFGYFIVETSQGQNALGLFAITNASIHFAVAAIIYRYKLGDRKAFYLAVALVAAFITIAVPVQMDGSWVTILWMGEGAFLFVVGRMKKIPLFEYFSFPLLTIACLSLLADWQTVSYRRLISTAEPMTVFINKDFASSFFAACCFGLAFLVNRLKRYPPLGNKTILIFLGYLLPAAFAILIYNAFRMEIDTYFYSREIQTAVRIRLPYTGTAEIHDESLKFLNAIWQLNYSMLFVAALSFLNIRKIKDTSLGIVSAGLSIANIIVLLTFGIYFIRGLRQLYLSNPHSDLFSYGFYLIGVRYVTFVFAAALITGICFQIRQTYITRFLPGEILILLFDLGLAFTSWVILSNELVTWLSVYGIEEKYRLGLSILWGFYSVTLIVIGIVSKKKQLRVFAMLVFGVTLMKLFLYDMADLETIPKTILFVAIGFMLLVASFLYNKYTKFIFDGADQN